MTTGYSSGDVSCVRDLFSARTAPLKIYCLFYGLGSGCLVAFLPVFYGILGVSAVQNGILGALAPLTGFFASPFWSGVADKRGRVRGVLVMGLCAFVLFNVIKGTVPTASACNHHFGGSGTWSDAAAGNSSLNVSATNSALRLLNVEKRRQWITFLLMATIIVVGEFFSSCVLGLADAVILSALGPRGERNYGRQRLWHALGWGLGNVGSGALANYYADECGNGNYVVHFVGFGVLTGLSALIMAFFVKTDESSRKVGSGKDAKLDIVRGVCGVFSQAHAAVFILAVFFLAVFMAIIDNFLFWFLKVLGGSELLIGASLLCMSVAEVLVFALAGCFIDKAGHFYCLCIVFFVYAARFAAYAALTSPWWVLPVELLHGVTFALMWATCVSYAKRIAPPGMEATMQGVLTSVYYGIGRVTGSLLGGVLYSEIGPRLLFVLAASAAGLCSTLLAIYQRCYTAPQCSLPQQSQVEQLQLLVMETSSEFSADSEAEDQ